VYKLCARSTKQGIKRYLNSLGKGTPTRKVGGMTVQGHPHVRLSGPPGAEVNTVKVYDRKHCGTNTKKLDDPGKPHPNFS